MHLQLQFITPRRPIPIESQKLGIDYRYTRLVRRYRPVTRCRCRATKISAALLVLVYTLLQ